MAYCTLGTNFLPENRASESQPPCPTSIYLIHTLGWRWARRELSEQPQRSTWDAGSNVRNWQRAKMAFEQGAREVVWVWLFALARRGGVGGMSPPPESVCPNFAQQSDDWRLALGNMVGNVNGNEENDDRRCSPRRSWCGSTMRQHSRNPPPRSWQASRPWLEAPPPTAHGRSAAFFHQILMDVKVFFSLPNCAHGPD